MAQALVRDPDDIKVIIQFSETSSKPGEKDFN